MKSNLLFCIYFLCITSIYGQVLGIGTSTPNAKLEIKSSNEATPVNTDGVLIPKADEFPAIDPTILQDGMLLFLTGNGTPNKGFYYWDESNTSWISLGVVKSINDLTDGKSDSDGSDNGSSVYLGIDAGANDDVSDNRNTGIGYQSLNKNTTGGYSTAIGYQSLFNNTTGGNNTGLGIFALLANSTGGNNTAIGSHALYRNTASENTALGFFSLFGNTTGIRNVAIGVSSMVANTTGSANVAIGYKPLYSMDSGIRNIGIGIEPLYSMISGTGNIGIGYQSTYLNTNGIQNISIGTLSLRNNTFGDYNIAIGFGSLRNTLGSLNIGVGFLAGDNHLTGINNIIIGNNSETSTTTVSNQVTLGNGNHNSYRMYAASWTNVSDRNLKQHIKDIPVGLEFVKLLRPVEFVYNHAENNEKTFGFIAQEVKEAVRLSNLEDNIIVTQFDENTLGIKTTELISVLTKAIQEQQVIIESLENQLKDKNNVTEDLGIRLARLESLLERKIELLD